MSSGAAARVAVLGGGVAGCAAAARLNRLGAHVTLLEMGRGAGGRVATRRTREDRRIEVDHGAPLAEIVTDEGQAMAKELCDKGWIEGISDPVGRLEVGASSLQVDEDKRDVKRFKGKPSMSRLCEGLLDGSGVAPKFGNMVRGFETICDGEGGVVGWRLLDKENKVLEECDWLVVSGSGVAHSRWSKTFGGTPPLAEVAASVKDPKLDAAIAAIESVGSKPVQAVMLGFDGEAAAAWDALPFYVAEIDGDETIAKIVLQRRNGMVFVVAHSTHAFAEVTSGAFGSTSTAARVGGVANDSTIEEEVLAALVKGLDRCVAGFSPKPSLEAAAFGPVLHRWGNAFPASSAFDSPEDAFAPTSRIAFAGDYVGSRSGSIEGAMLSGVAAAEMVIAHAIK